MIEDFYPTPENLLDKMTAGLKLEEIKKILEPSAGKGDICDYLKKRRKYSSYYNRDF